MKHCLFCLTLMSLMAVCMTGCGPKDIGTDTSSDMEARPAGIAVEDQLRYPVYGVNSTQQRLYFWNRPSTMASVQEWRRQMLRRPDEGEAALSPEDSRPRSTQQQRSLFRQ